MFRSPKPPKAPQSLKKSRGFGGFGILKGLDILELQGTPGQSPGQGYLLQQTAQHPGIFLMNL